MDSLLVQIWVTCAHPYLE